MTAIDPAATMTRIDKVRLTRACRAIADIHRDCEEDYSCPALCALAWHAYLLRDIPLMRRAVELWEELPAKQRAKIARRAADSATRQDETQRHAHAAKAPYIERPAHLNPHDRGRTADRFRALNIAVHYGTPLSHPLRTVVYDARFAQTKEAYAVALVVWDAWPAEEREAIITTARTWLSRFSDPADWWVHALTRAVLAPVEEDDALSAIEQARLSKRFATMSREEYAAD